MKACAARIMGLVVHCERTRRQAAIHTYPHISEMNGEKVLVIFCAILASSLKDALLGLTTI